MGEFFDYFVLAILGIAFSSFSLFIIYGILRTWPIAAASAQWPSTDGIILHSELEQDSTGDDKSYRAAVRYQYEVDSKTHVGNRITFGTYSPDRATARKWVKKYSPDTKVRVYYDPASPEDSVLEPGSDPEGYLFFLGLGCLFLCLGIGFVVGFFYKLSMLR